MGSAAKRIKNSPIVSAWGVCSTFIFFRKMLSDAEFEIFISNPNLGERPRIQLQIATPIVKRVYTTHRKDHRCNKCASCLHVCEKCQNCMDKPRFGGKGKRKKACAVRPRCKSPIIEEWIDPSSIPTEARAPKECKPSQQ